MIRKNLKFLLTIFIIVIMSFSVFASLAEATDVEYRESCLSDDYSPIKDNHTTVNFVTYTGEIPTGNEYRNAEGGYGGCTQAVIKSAVDMFGIELPKAIRTVLDRQREEVGRDGNIASVVSQLKIDDYLFLLLI